MLGIAVLKSSGKAGRSSQINLKHCRSWKQGLTPDLSQCGGEKKSFQKVHSQLSLSCESKRENMEHLCGDLNTQLRKPALGFCQAGHNHPQLSLGKEQQSISKRNLFKSPSKGSSRAAFQQRVELMETTKGCREVEGTSFHPACQCWPREHVT